MAPIHPASQVEASKHSQIVLELTRLRVDRNLVGSCSFPILICPSNSLITTTEHIVHETIDTVNQAVGSPCSSRGRQECRRSDGAEFAEFAANVIGRAEIPTAVLLVTLVYIHRSRPHLSVEAEEWAFHRVFLGALMVASKVCTFQIILPKRVDPNPDPLIQFTNDSTLRNVHWAIATGIFGKRDVGKIEREFLDVLDWDLTVSEEEIACHYPSIIALYPRAQRVAAASSPPRPSRCPTFILDPFSEDSDSGSSATSSPHTPCDSEKALGFVKHDPSGLRDFHGMQQSSHPSSEWSQNQNLIAALASEYFPVVAV